MSDEINWLDVQSNCALWGGYLTSIATERENNLIYTKRTKVFQHT